MIAPSGCSSPMKNTLPMSRVEDAPEQRQVVVGRGDQALVEERERDLVAGAVDDDVGLDLAAVGEHDRALGQPRDVRLGRDLAVRDAGEDVVGDRRVRLQHAVLGLRAARSAPCRRRRPQQRPEERLAHARTARPPGWRSGRAAGRTGTSGSPTRRAGRPDRWRPPRSSTRRRCPSPSCPSRARRRACRGRTPGRRPM